MKYLDNQDVYDFLKVLEEFGTLYLPTVEENRVNFCDRWDKNEPLMGLRSENSVLSPKDLFFPQTEDVFRFSTEGKEFEVKEKHSPSSKKVIFGLRACDIRSLRLLDLVFAEGEYRDEAYTGRRNKNILITWSCTEPEETCFCTSFDSDPGRPEFGDILAIDLKDGLILEAQSEVGEEILDKADDLLRSAVQNQIKKAERLQLEAKDKVALEVGLDNIKNELSDRFDDPIYEKYASRCLGCGICTYLCPTCHCYDLESETWGQEGLRYRCWDSCMFSNYTRLAGGENPRPTKTERLRNRFLHKLQYFPEMYEQYGCTGCGRCLKYCPVSVDITKFIRQIKGVKTDG